MKHIFHHTANFSFDNKISAQVSRGLLKSVFTENICHIECASEIMDEYGHWIVLADIQARNSDDLSTNDMKAINNAISRHNGTILEIKRA